MTRPVAEPLPDDDEDVPPEEDPYWDDVTAETLAFLRRARWAHRREQVLRAMYAGYVGALFLLIYVGPSALYGLQSPPPVGDGPRRVAATIVPAAAALSLAVLVGAVRDALWRGPALLDAATAAWLLPTPVRRGPLLRPRLRRSLVVAAVLGTAVGASAGVLLRMATGGSVPVLALAGAALGLLDGVLAVGLGGLIEASGRRPQAALRRIGSLLWVLPALPGAAAVIAATGALPSAVDRVVLWSGPWGWAVQPLAAAVPAAPAAGAGWRVGLLLAVAAATAAAALAHHRITAVPAVVLRARAAAVADVAQSLGSLQPRRARLLVDEAQGRRPRTGRRLPAPRRRGLLVLWRDATALVRSPSRAWWGVIWITAAGLASVGAADPTLRTHPGAGGGHGIPGGPSALAIALMGVALIAGYLGTAQLVEAARLDADDPRLVQSLPLSPRQLADEHLILPVLVTIVDLGLLGAVLAVTGHAGPGVVPGLVAQTYAAPALAGAALVSAYRGPVLMRAAVQLVAWYARGPLVAILLLWVLGLVLSTRTAAALPAALVMYYWARSRADAVLGTARDG